MSEKGKGVAAILMAMFVFTTVNTLFKTIEHSYPITQILFLRYFFALIPYLVMLATNREWKTLTIDNHRVHFMRAILSVISLGCFFKSFMLLPLAEAITLSYMSCLFIVILSFSMLGERVTRFSLFSVSLGFVGVMIIAKPSGDALNSGVVFVLISAFLEAFLMVQGRQLTTLNSNSAIVLYQGVFACVITGLTLPFVWESLTYYDFLVLVTLGIGGGIGQYLITVAYRHAPSGLLSPMIYTSLLWSFSYGMLFLGEIPTLSLYVGSALIVMAGLFGLYQKNHRLVENVSSLN